MKKVVKFGGSSLASAAQFKKVGDIIRKDPSRRYVVPSAPGKRFKDDTNDKILPWEEELDNIIEQGALELDYDKRKIIYDKYQQIIYDQRPFIYLYSPLIITAVRQKIKNLHPTPLGGTMHNIDELYIEN